MSAKKRRSSDDGVEFRGKIIAAVGLAILFGIGGAAGGCYLWMRSLRHSESVSDSTFPSCVIVGAVLGAAAGVTTVFFGTRG
ncbi:MAG: hypothetical protein ACOC8E_00980 [Planctomycetota bacterium]